MAAIAKTCQKLLMRDSSLAFLSGAEVLPDKTWHMPMHRHPMHELIVVLGGKMRLETAEVTVEVERGDVLFYRAGMAHKETSDPGNPVNTLYIAFKGRGAVITDLPLRLRDDDARVRQMVAWLVRDHQSGLSPASQTPLLSAVLGELQRLREPSEDPWLIRLRDYMQQHHAQSLTLADLAREGGLSKFAFVRRFKRLSGQTPMKELQRLRLNQARALLLTSGLPVKVIAPAVGLTDEYQLSKLFRKHFKLSPSELRKRAR